MSKFMELVNQGAAEAAGAKSVVPTLDLADPVAVETQEEAASVLRRTLRVPARLAAAARAERDELEVTLTDVVMLAAGEHEAALRSEAESVGGRRLGGARVLRRREPAAGSDGELTGIQWLGTSEDLAALDDLVEASGFGSRNALVTEVLHRRYSSNT